MTSRKEPTPRESDRTARGSSGRAEPESHGETIDKELYGFLIGFAADLANICDLGQLSALVAERATSLVGADEGVLVLETRPPATDADSLQITAPLRSGDEALGVLIARRQLGHLERKPDSEPPHSHREFSREDKRRLTLLASIAGVAVASLKRAQAIRRYPNWRARSLDLLREIGLGMRATLELGTLAHQLIGAIASALDAEAGKLSLLDNSGQVVVRAVAGALGNDLIGTRLDIVHSVAGWVIRHGHAALIAEPGTDPRTAADHPSSEAGFVPRSLLAAPLIADGKTIGAIEVANRRDGPFEQDDLHLLESGAVLAAAAIENCRVYERLQRRVRQQENIIRVGHSMRSADQVDAVLQEIVDLTLSTIPTAVAAAVHLHDEAENVLKLQCSAGDPPWDAGKRPFSVSHGILRQVLAGRQVENVADVLCDARFEPETGGVAYRSLIVAPIIADDRPLGTLSASSLDRNGFGPDHEHVIHTLAVQIAVTLRNARLHIELAQRADELEAAYRELQALTLRKTQFVQNTSHELRTPLTFIRGYLEMLQEGGFGPLSDEQRQVASFLNRKSLQLAELVNNIASLAQVELGPEDIEAVDLVNVVAASVSARRERSVEAGVQVKTEWPAAPTMVNGHQYRLMQILCHLLDNAIKFSPSGGEIRVQVWKDCKYAFVRVSDQGIGISPDEQKLIFDRFYQIDGSTTRRFGGTGLGLAIVKETVEAHGGTVQVESSGKEGAGAAFEICLPLLDTANPQD